ncbi:MAG: SdrD B-like domain-containing protein, partial [Tepidisphaerales bacterium]
FSQAAIEIDPGAALDIGSATDPTDPGNNTFNIQGQGSFFRAGPAGPILPLVDNLGDTYLNNGQAFPTLQGMVWLDLNNDGQVDFGEPAIPGIDISFSGANILGQSISLSTTTDSSGIFTFPNLYPGTYSITEGSVPNTYTNGIDAIGTTDGSTPNGLNPDHHHFTSITLLPGQNGINYNFGQLPAAGTTVAKGQAAGIGFWQNKNGQKLIASFTGIGGWLAHTLPAIFGANAGVNNLTGKSASYVANIYAQKFALKDNLDAQLMATALNCYATSTLLGGAHAVSYGFSVSTYGLLDATWNVGTSGAAFGVANNTTVRVLQLLDDADTFSVKGVLYHNDSALRKLALAIFAGINSKGGI